MTDTPAVALVVVERAYMQSGDLAVDPGDVVEAGGHVDDDRVALHEVAGRHHGWERASGERELSEVRGREQREALVSVQFAQNNIAHPSYRRRLVGASEGHKVTGRG